MPNTVIANKTLVLGEKSDIRVRMINTSASTIDAGGPVVLDTAQRNVAPDYVFQDDGGVFTSYGAEASDTAAGDVLPLATTPAVDDAFYVGMSDEKFRQVRIDMGTAGAHTLTLVW